MIGSYNLDPRSAWINEEGFVIINDSPAFARLVEEKTWERIEAATPMQRDGSYADGSHYDSPIRVITIILRPVAEIFSDLL
jgi:phosphatidylserine/phosphatidylglycerophosphate/cardiolipin synthase-like enzyme